MSRNLVPQSGAQHEVNDENREKKNFTVFLAWDGFELQLVKQSETDEKVSRSFFYSFLLKS